jgi:hypothetical protein
MIPVKKTPSEDVPMNCNFDIWLGYSSWSHLWALFRNMKEVSSFEYAKWSEKRQFSSGFEEIYSDRTDE